MKKLCKPCGHCPTCAGNKRRRDKVKRQARLLRAAARAIVDELVGMGADEWRQHPNMRAKNKLVDRILAEAGRR